MIARKMKAINAINYEEEIEKFIKSNVVAFIPDDQRDTNRYHWHCAGEKYNIATKTIKIWRNISLCGSHDLPIIDTKEDSIGESWYDSDVECDYDADFDEGFCYRDKWVFSKLRTVVIFNEESSIDIKNMNINQIKDYLLEKRIIKKNKRQQYCI